MSVKLIILKSQEEILADLKELVLEDKVVGFQLTEPRVLSLSRASTLTEEENKISVNFSKWQIYTDDKVFQIPADWVVTICEPIESLKKSYEENVNECAVSDLSE